MHEFVVETGQYDVRFLGLQCNDVSQADQCVGFYPQQFTAAQIE